MIEKQHIKIQSLPDSKKIQISEKIQPASKQS